MEQRWSSKFEIKPGSWVFVPTDNQVLYGGHVKTSIETRWQPPAFYFHLRDGGHVKALHSHVNHKYFLHLDISNFFGCINRSRITRNLKGIFSYDIAREVALKSTVKDPDNSLNKFILPFGFVQSPIIASMCLAKSCLGKYLSFINREKEYSVSVYMDDIIVSSDNESRLELILDKVIPISDRSRFFLNKEKQEGPSSRVTVFNIELSHHLLSITDKRLDEFKEAYVLAENEHVKNGIFGYVESVNNKQSVGLI